MAAAEKRFFPPQRRSLDGVAAVVQEGGGVKIDFDRAGFRATEGPAKRGAPGKGVSIPGRPRRCGVMTEHDGALIDSAGNYARQCS